MWQHIFQVWITNCNFEIVYYYKFIMQNLKKKWGISSNLQIFLILTVFAINGSFASWVASPVTIFFGIDKELVSPIVYWPLRIALIFPIYQITLPLTGFLLGQFKFFWSFEKKFLSRIGLGFLFKSNK